MRSLALWGVTALLVSGSIVSGPTSSSAHTWYVTADGLGDAPSIQEAVNRAADGDTVLVAPGIYAGTGNQDINFWGNDLVLVSEAGPEYTIIDCHGGEGAPHRGLKFHSGETPSSVVEGFTIQGGYGHFDFSAFHSVGGAVLCAHSSPTLKNCVFRHNSADYGGAIFTNYSTAVLLDCTFQQNEATWPAGGLYCYRSSPSLTGCVFSENRTGTSGGGVYGYESAPVIVDCVFWRNEAAVFGGGLGCSRLPAPRVVGCTFAENVAELGGALGSTSSSAPTVENTIMAFNLGGETVFCGNQQSVPTLSCCDVYGNTGGDWVGHIADQYGVEGNISEDPLFCGGPGLELRLERGSPCLEGYGCGRMGAFGAGCLPEGVARPGGRLDGAPHALRAARVTASTWGLTKALFR